MKSSRQIGLSYVRGLHYSYAQRDEENQEVVFHRRRWDERARLVKTYIANQSMLHRTRIRLTDKRWWPAKWRSAHRSEFVTLMIQLEFVADHMMLPLELRDAAFDLQKVAALWPASCHQMSALAVQTALSEMRHLDAALRKISPRMSTAMTPEHKETRKRLEHGAKILKGLLRPKQAPVQMGLEKKGSEKMVPAPLAIDLNKARSMGLSDILIRELDAFLVATKEWGALQTNVDQASKRNQVDYFISQIDGAWKAMVNDPIISKSPDAQEQFADMVRASRERIQKVVHEAEVGKVDGFMGTLSALRLQLER